MMTPSSRTDYARQESRGLPVLIEKEANAEPHNAIASFALNAAKGW
jgi:hypothetical protein